MEIGRSKLRFTKASFHRHVQEPCRDSSPRSLRYLSVLPCRAKAFAKADVQKSRSCPHQTSIPYHPTSGFQPIRVKPSLPNSVTAHNVSRLKRLCFGHGHANIAHCDTARALTQRRRILLGPRPSPSLKTTIAAPLRRSQRCRRTQPGVARPPRRSAAKAGVRRGLPRVPDHLIHHHFRA